MALRFMSGQRERKGCTLVRIVAGANGATVSSDNCIDDREADSKSLRFGCEEWRE
jgi:hypothetical protein